VHHLEDPVEVAGRMGDRQGPREILVLYVDDQQRPAHAFPPHSPHETLLLTRRHEGYPKTGLRSIYPSTIRSSSTSRRAPASRSPTAWNVTVSAGETSMRAVPRPRLPSGPSPVMAWNRPRAGPLAHRRRIGRPSARFTSTVHKSRVTSVSSASSREAPSRMHRSIRPTRATTS